jgi:ectoine hydroxylase-related dioxygenase (phytanoyl-CoA dioxygenase family)
MLKEINKVQIEHYRENGFVRLPGFLTPDEINELKAAVLEGVATTEKRIVPGTGAYYDAVWTRRVNLWKNNKTVKRYMLHENLGRILSRLASVDALRIWHDQALIKEPFANPTGYHLDIGKWSFSSAHAISVWIALEDATLCNGCLWFVPGSHRIATFDTVDINENLGGLFEIFPGMAGIDPVPVPLKAGDCSFHNGLLAHGAGANMTRGRRIAMTCAYMPDGSVFNGRQNVLPDDYFQSLAVGDVLENDDCNPLVFRNGFEEDPRRP